MRLMTVGGLCIGLAVAAGDRPAEAACQSAGKVLLQDQFKTLAKSWRRFPNYHVEDGEMVITPPARFTTTTLHWSKLPTDLDICVETHIKPPPQSDECAGIVFWAIDFDNLYSFEFSSSGKASFWRRQGGKWLKQVAWQPVANFRLDTSVTDLGVTIRGTHARLLINGQLFQEVTGDPSKGAARIGLVACSADTAATIVAFDNLVVTPAAAEPSKEGAKETKAP